MVNRNFPPQPYGGEGPVAAPRPVQSMPQQVAPRKKPAPPEQTHAENFYFVKQMQSRTPVAVVLNDGECCAARGMVRPRMHQAGRATASPNILLYKHSIKYLYKDGDEAAQGGTNGQ